MAADYQGESANSKNPLWTGRRISAENLKAIEETKDDASVLFKETVYRH